jgi:hypothetical protein
MPHHTKSFLRGFAAGFCATARGKIAGVLLLATSLAGCVSANMPTMTDNLPTADQPRGVVYLSIGDFCKTTTAVSADIRLAYQDKGAGVQLWNQIGQEIALKDAAKSGLFTVKIFTKVYRFELPPGDYVIHSLFCQNTFFLVQEKLTGKPSEDQRVGVARFNVKSNEVVSGGALNAVQAGAGLQLSVRPLNNTEMQYLREAYPAEAARIVYRPVKSGTPLTTGAPPAR